MFEIKMIKTKFNDNMVFIFLLNNNKKKTNLIWFIIQDMK